MNCLLFVCVLLCCLLQGAAVDSKHHGSKTKSKKILPHHLTVDGKVKRCGVRDLTDAEFAAREAADKRLSAKKFGHGRSLSQKGDRNSPAFLTVGGRILTYFHVVHDPVTKEGLVSKEQLDAQIDILNSAYAQGKWDFRIKDIIFHANSSWTGLLVDSTEERDMYRALRKGKAHALNIFLTPRYEFLGVSSFPSDYVDNPLFDGVTIDSATVPGGSATPYDEGKTLVHEVGHWMGLHHTFRGGCGDTGDGVWDTPAEAEENFDCIPRDSCPNRPGMDPIHNFMDYSDDACMNHFTKGQFDRMQIQWALYRSNNPFDFHGFGGLLEPGLNFLRSAFGAGRGN